MSINYEPNLCNFVGYLRDDVVLNSPENGPKSATFEIEIVRYFNLKSGGRGAEKNIAKFEIWDTAAEFLANNSVRGDRIWISSSYKTSGTFRVNRFKILKRKQVDA